MLNGLALTDKGGDMPGVDGRTGAGAAAAAAVAAGAAAAGAVGAAGVEDVSAVDAAVCAKAPPAPINRHAKGAAKNSFFIKDSPAVNYGLRFDSIRLTIVEILKAKVPL